MRVFTLTLAALALASPLVAQTPAETQPDPAPAKPALISGQVMASMLVKHVTPVTPIMARERHISGTVVCLVDISAAGVPTRVEAKSGADVLREAAVDTIKKYRYKPYLLNGQPIAVETTVTVTFAS